MSDWYTTNIHVTGKDMRKFKNFICSTLDIPTSLTSSNYPYDASKSWLGNILLGAGFTKDEERALYHRNTIDIMTETHSTYDRGTDLLYMTDGSDYVNDMGDITDCALYPEKLICVCSEITPDDKADCLEITAESKYGECADVFTYAAAKLGLDVNIEYDSHNRDTDYSVCSDPKKYGEYYVYAPEFDLCEGMISASGLESKLHKYFHDDVSCLDSLISRYEADNDGVYITRNDRVPLEPVKLPSKEEVDTYLKSNICRYENEHPEKLPSTYTIRQMIEDEAEEEARGEAEEDFDE